MALKIAVATLCLILVATIWSVLNSPVDPWAQERFAQSCYLPDWGDYNAPPGTDYGTAVCELRAVKP